MTVEIISISTKVWDRAGIELATLGSAVRLASVARHGTNCATRSSQSLCVFSKLNCMKHIKWNFILSPGWDFGVLGHKKLERGYLRWRILVYIYSHAFFKNEGDIAIASVHPSVCPLCYLLLNLWCVSYSHINGVCNRGQ